MNPSIRSVLVAAAVIAAAGVGARAMAAEAKGLGDRAALTLEAAMQRVAQDEEARDGTIVNAELEMEDAQLVYSFDVAIGTRTLELHLDAGSGAIVKRGSEDEDHSDLTQTKVSIAAAVKTALGAAPGKAVSAAIERNKRGRFIDVEIESNGKKREVIIDAETGAVTK